jgi:hypothetical protein
MKYITTPSWSRERRDRICNGSTSLGTARRLNLADPGGEEDHAPPALRNSIVCSIKYLAESSVAHSSERAPKPVHSGIGRETRDILHHERLRLERSNETKELKDEIVPTISDLSAAIAGPHLRESLAWWTTCEQVQLTRPQMCRLENSMRWHIENILVQQSDLRMVDPVRLGRHRIDLNSSDDCEAGALESEREPASASEEVNGLERGRRHSGCG